MSMNVSGIKDPKKSIKTTSVGKSVDYELVETIQSVDVNNCTPAELKKRNDAIIKLMDKYNPCYYAARNKLKSMNAGHAMSIPDDIFENYKYDSYDHFMMAVSGQDLSRIQHMKGSWCFYIRLTQYLAAYNRKIINTYCGGMSSSKALKETENKDGSVTFKNEDGKEYTVTDFNSVLLKTDKKSRVVKVCDNYGNVLLANNKPTTWRKLNAYNVRSEWVTGNDGEEMSVFDTDHVPYTTVENELERKEESKVLGEAITNAYKKFSPLQCKIWDSRIIQSVEQQEAKIEQKLSADKLNTYSKPKFDDLALKCNTTSDVIKSNLKAMKLIVQQEISASNRKYKTDVDYK